MKNEINIAPIRAVWRTQQRLTEALIYFFGQFEAPEVDWDHVIAEAPDPGASMRRFYLQRRQQRQQADAESQ